MNAEELSQFISDKTTDMINENLDYIKEHHTRELDALLSGGENIEINAVIGRTLQSYLRTAIEFSTINTISVLQSLGVIPPAQDLQLKP